ncbi:MAG TPA: GlsB/YeaQ/YmgE family stress response membrane protein [Gemmatimonadaceae bacterium]|nr:GlsB/YeaQ/YmgE family stress response membrane protein [Gemmatimonadaceae bacterium]
MIWMIIVGIIAGFLAGKVMNGSGYGILMDLLLGVAGGIVGGFVLGLVGIGARGLIGSILVATFGAVLLIWIVRQFRANRGTI